MLADVFSKMCTLGGARNKTGEANPIQSNSGGLVHCGLALVLSETMYSQNDGKHLGDVITSHADET